MPRLSCAAPPPYHDPKTTRPPYPVRSSADSAKHTKEGTTRRGGGKQRQGRKKHDASHQLTEALQEINRGQLHFTPWSEVLSRHSRQAVMPGKKRGHGTLLLSCENCRNCSLAARNGRSRRPCRAAFKANFTPPASSTLNRSVQPKVKLGHVVRYQTSCSRVPSNPGPAKYKRQDRGRRISSPIQARAGRASLEGPGGCL